MRACGVTERTDRISAEDGTPLFVRTFTPPARVRAVGGPPRTLLMIHGATDHGGRRVHVARFFAERGWTVRVMDLRGHGRSGGVPMHVRRFGRYVADAARVLDWSADNRDGAGPARTAVLGGSMGGLVAVRLAQRFPDRLAAAALCSPLLGLKWRLSKLVFAAGAVLSVVRPKTRFRWRVESTVDERGGPFAHDPPDPLRHGSVTARWFFAVRRARLQAWNQAADTRVPLLVVQSGDDHVIDPDAGRRWVDAVAAAGNADATFRLAAHARHDLLREPDWDRHAAVLAEWLDARVPASIARERLAA